MNPRKPRPLATNPLSSREVLQRIGLSDDPASVLDLDLLLDDDPLASPDEELAQALRTQFARLTERHPFKPGDLVTWKPGMRNRRWPFYGRPMIVVEVLAQPVLDDEMDSGDPYFREPLDLVLGLLIEEAKHRGDFFTWHFDSRRFQPWQTEER